MNMKTLMILLTSFICFGPIYGQSKKPECKEETERIMLDSVQISNYMVLDELQQNIVPYLIKHKYTPDRYGVYVMFEYLPQRGHFLFFAGIENFIDHVTENYVGYCIIKGYRVFIIGNEARDFIKKVNNRQRAFKPYRDTIEFLLPVDGVTEWTYFFNENHMELILHTDWHRDGKDWFIK